ncbi:hypothetical protein DFR49_1699 [Hephaestia caeni]|uniref:Uncharacterized protein n=1 Tax=Hephaestia caeni TaxID=645617 RepID=A0A397PN13_9SPHN|nr:hypothetical protein [Hephaestia caeni]RIA47131.1 hypothetical protein DFR49_1699 [Hephaestia caeni]
MPRLRQKQRRRPPPRAFWILVAGLIGCAALLWWHYRNRPDPAPPVVSNRQRLVSAAIAALRADPNVADIVYSPAGDQWDATPIAGTDDATAFARYVCFVLDAQHVIRPATSVRVIDNDRLEASGFDYSRASRGRLTCETETR